MASFNTAYYSRGALIKDRRKIAKRYIKGKFCIDLLTLVVTFPRIFFGNHELVYIECLRVLRIIFLMGYVSKLEDHMRLTVIWSGVVRLLKLWVTLFIITHVIACSVHSIGSAHEDDDSSWLDVYGFRRESIARKYIVSAYWSVTTTFTVGYGDITPHNDKERIFALFIMMVATVVFGYTMNTINIIIEEMDEFKTEKKKRIRRANLYMKTKGVSKDIQMRIRKYLDYTLDEDNYKKNLESELVGMLNSDLKREIYVEVYGKTLRDSPLFQQNNFTKGFLGQVSECLNEIFLSPEQEIIREGDIEDQSLYFLSRGKIQIYINSCRKPIKVLNKKHNYFGEVSFFTGKPRSASVKSLNFSEVFCLPKKRFLSVLSSFRVDKEQFHYLKDMVNLYDRYDLIKVVCYCCDKIGHTITECPSLQFTFKKHLVIKSYIEDCKLFKKNFPRRRFKLTYTRQQVMEAAETLKRDLGQDYAISTRLSILNQEQIKPSYFEDPHQTKIFVREMKRLRTLEQQMLSIVDTLSPEARARLMKSLHLPPDPNLLPKDTFYDPYLGTLNFDRVANYELYFPKNNIIRIIPLLEEKRVAAIMSASSKLNKPGTRESRLLKRGLHAFGALKNIPVASPRVLTKSHSGAEPANRASIVLHSNSAFSSFNKQGSSDSHVGTIRGLTKLMNLAQNIPEDRVNSLVIKPTMIDVLNSPNPAFWKLQPPTQREEDYLSARRMSNYLNGQDISNIEDEIYTSRSWSPVRNGTPMRQKTKKQTRLTTSQLIIRKENSTLNEVQLDKQNSKVQYLSPNGGFSTLHEVESLNLKTGYSKKESFAIKPSEWKVDSGDYDQGKNSKVDVDCPIVEEVVSQISERRFESRRLSSQTDKNIPEDVRPYLAPLVGFFGTDKIMQALGELNGDNFPDRNTD